MMFGFGFIMMILVLGLPVVLVVAIVALTWGLTKRASDVAFPLSQQPADLRALWHRPHTPRYFAGQVAGVLTMRVRNSDWLVPLRSMRRTAEPSLKVNLYDY